ncbi:MAG TPA: chaplin family protein [Spirillospora sp.]
MIKKLAATGILGFAVTASALSAAPAYAGGYDGEASHNTTAGNVGVLNGTQVIAPISAAVDVCGNAVAVVGFAGAGCKGGAKVID